MESVTPFKPFSNELSDIGIAYNFYIFVSGDIGVSNFKTLTLLEVGLLNVPHLEHLTLWRSV